jgi:alpha-glucosidase (family GH31 glycosyl hydrolase)
LAFTFQCLASGEFFFKIYDRKNKRFEVLQGEPFAKDIYENFTFPLTVCGATLNYTNNPFDFKITRTSTQTILFSTYNIDFIFSNYFIQIGTELASNRLFGLGERFSVNFRKYEAKWTVFNKAGDQVIDRGTGNNTYGYYPFYLLIDDRNEGHINYLKSTNAMDVFKTKENGRDYLTFKIIGGILNFRFKLGSSNITALIKSFHQTCIGKPAIPPFWSLGFHQSRWGYDSADTLMKVLS